MKTAIAFNHEQKTLNLALGINETRSREIIDWCVDNLTGVPSKDIEAVVNEFEKPEEVYFALYNLRPVEEEYQVENEEELGGGMEDEDFPSGSLEDGI